MTSKQVMLTVLVSAAACGLAWLSGCAMKQPGSTRLDSPYATRRVWAVAPLRNESGARHADGLAIADRLAQRLENASNLDVLPVNRVLSAMEALKLPGIDTPGQALQVLGVLGCDGLVVGSITAYDPYDPPKLGLALELYTSARVEQLDTVDVRRLQSSATDESMSLPSAGRARQPVTVVSSYFDAADPYVRHGLERYAYERGPVRRSDDFHRYRISMDLYSEFVSYAMSWKLLDAEKKRLAPPPVASAPVP